MQKIIPNLWFDTQAKEATEYYVQAFSNIGEDAKVTSSVVLRDTPSGDADALTFEVDGYAIMTLSGGPYFKLNPSISFMVNFDPSKDPQAIEHLDALWESLSEGGKVMMPLQEYPFSKRYGWTEDKFGMSWQLILTNPDGEPRPFIIPSMLFANAAYGKAEEAGDFYISVFKNAKRGTLVKYPAGMEPHTEGTVMFSDFTLENEWLTAMDGPGTHDFNFNEALSLLIQCDSQEEIDYFWEKLSAVPESEQCGWVKDAFGVSWQIAPTRMQEMMAKGTPEQIDRVVKAFMPMKKLDIEALEKAYAG
jgi:predicted 3-demethylubiquinone-9 3-methyltransferase (glyoxalase superfamily)